MDGRTGSAGSHGVSSSPRGPTVANASVTDPGRSRHRLRNVKSESSEISTGSLLFLGLFVLAAALIMFMA